MKFDGNIKQLGHFPLGKIAKWMLEQDKSVWDEYTFRQKVFKTHRYTESMFLLYNHNKINVKNRTFISKFSPDIQNIQNKVIDTVGNSKLIPKRIIIPRLKPHGFIRRHVDSGDFLTTHWRCHFPLITDKRIKFFVGDEEIHMKENHGYIINNQRKHGVSNNSPHDRYHLIIDFGE